MPSEMASSMLRGWRGTRRMSPRFSSSTTMRWTDGGVTPKNLSMSASAGARPLSWAYVWMKARYWPCFSVKFGVGIDTIGFP